VILSFILGLLTQISCILWARWHWMMPSTPSMGLQNPSVTSSQVMIGPPCMLRASSKVRLLPCMCFSPPLVCPVALPGLFLWKNYTKKAQLRQGKGIDLYLKIATIKSMLEGGRDIE